MASSIFNFFFFKLARLTYKLVSSAPCKKFCSACFWTATITQQTWGTRKGKERGKCGSFSAKNWNVPTVNETEATSARALRFFYNLRYCCPLQCDPQAVIRQGNRGTLCVCHFRDFFWIVCTVLLQWGVSFTLAQNIYPFIRPVPSACEQRMIWLASCSFQYFKKKY